MARYRLSLAISFFYKHYIEVARRFSVSTSPQTMFMF